MKHPSPRKAARNTFIFGGLMILGVALIMVTMYRGWSSKVNEEHQKTQKFEDFLAISERQMQEIQSKSARERAAKEVRKRRAELEDSGFKERREEAWSAYNRGQINLAEREGLLARIRDEEEKLKRGD